MKKTLLLLFSFVVLAAGQVNAEITGTSDDLRSVTFDMGSKDAPVTIITPYSQTCPWTMDFRNNIYPKLKKNYIDQGKVRLISMPFAQDDDDLKLLKYSHCASDMQATWNIQQALYKNRKAFAAQWKKYKKVKDINHDKAVSIARENGLTAADEGCIHTTELDNKLLYSRRMLQAGYGLYKTPQYVINGVVYRELNQDDFDWLLSGLLSGKN